MTARTKTLRSAYELMSLRFVLQQTVFALAVAGVFVVWLRIPDSRVVYVIATIILGAAGLAFAGGGEAWLLLRLTGSAPTRAKLVRGGLILLAAIVVWLAWSALLAHLSVRDELRAGYLNSQTPRRWRGLLSYPHILMWFGWGWSALQSLGTGVLVAITFACVVSARRWAAMKSALLCLSYWVVFLFASLFVGPWIYDLTQWTPAHGLGVELFSLVLRLSLAVALSSLLVSFVLAVLAVCVRHVEANYETPAGTPVNSQPRTTKRP